jgi:branched-subunit amino acid transport protein
MNLWLVMLLAGLGTFLIRLSFIWLLGRWQIPGWLRRGLRYVPPAVLTAIIFPEVFLPAGSPDFSPLSNARLVAALVACLVAWRTRNVLWTIGVGMLTLWLMQAVL